MNRWQIGNVRITRIIEMELAGGTRFLLPDATREAIRPIRWLQPHFADADGRLIMSIHALVVETPDRCIMVDTCIGNDKTRDIPGWNNLQTSFLDDLQKAGYSRESIDTVLCTHLHVDHVGWNTMREGDRWVPTFPNARYLLGEEEFRYWQNQSADGQQAAVFADSVQPVLDAGQVDLVDSSRRICQEVRLVPTPGHSPGHVSIHIASEGQEALITGDCMHHPCQIARPEWCSSADYDRDQARNTRLNLLREWAGTDLLVIGTHFASPTAGHIRDDGGDGFILRPLIDGGN